MKKKGKGLSFDQKRERMLNIFHKNKDVLNYEQLMKQSIKQGIPFPNVKDVVQSLKADSLVQCQKIGAGVFYWSFPSKAYQIMIDRIETTKKQIQKFKGEIIQLENDIQKEKVGRQESESRQQMASEIDELQERKKKLELQVEKYVRFDPERYESILKQNKELMTACNNQIDNLEQIKKFIKKNEIGIKNSQIEERYQIPADLQYFQ